jgi:hypothetical protein
MADLASVLADPNFVNANPATKQAIFDKWAPQDPNFANANPATQSAIKQKFGLAAMAAPEMPRPSEGMPTERQGPSTYERVREYVAPTVEALGAVGGGVLGAPLGPLGVVGGAGLGYGMAKEALNLADVYIGGKAPRTAAATVTEPIQNVLEGATMEAGGRVVAQGLGAAVGKVADMRQMSKQKAADIARNALGKDLPDVLNALRNAPSNATAAQATAGITNPTWQALIESRLASDPKFVLSLKNMNEAESVNALAKLAGGTTATEVRGTSEAAKNALNTVTGPLRESALARANLGQGTQQYASEAQRLAAEATNKVQDVRRFTAAGPRAEAIARTQLIEKGQPVGAAKYTYVGGDLPAMAEQAAADAAAGSLKIGEASRFAQGASDALKSVGIKPLETAPVVDKITSVLTNPKSGIPGNDVLEGAIKNVANDIAKWTDSSGVIDAWALESIRKNSVNAAIQQLRPGMDATAQRNLAAGVLTKIKPVIDDAIESAGGAGWKQYLADYTKGTQRIAEKKLSGEALNLFKTNKDAFVKLVEGNSPKEVEKILGSGSYDIAKEVSDNTLSVLRDQATKVVREANIKTQVAEGQDALKELLEQHISKLRLPSYINAYAATGNKAISILENKIGTKTMKTLTEAFKTPEGTADLLNTLPATERNRVLQLLSDPSKWKTPGVAAGVINALAPPRVELNNMAPDRP